MMLRKVSGLAKYLHRTAGQIAACGQAALSALREAQAARQALRREPAAAWPRCEGTVVIHSARTYAIHEFELYLASLLSHCGLKVHVLHDDGMLEHWDSHQAPRERYFNPFRSPWSISWPRLFRWQVICRALRNRGWDTVPYSQLFPSGLGTMQPDVRDHELALSSTKRFFQSGILASTPETEAYLGKCMKNCAVGRAVAREAIRRWKPDLFITTHGIYSVWGPACQEMKDAGVPVAVWQAVGTSKGHVRINDRHDGMMASTADWNDFFAGNHGNSAAIARGSSLLDARVNHEAADTREYFAGIEQGSGPATERSEGNSRHFAMFPNVIWDGDIPERNILFDGVLEWCLFAIEAIRNTPNRLTIRFHPSEVTRLKGSVQLETVLRERIPDIDSIPNLHLIPASARLDSYSFARSHVDVGLIYDGHLCLELTHLGIPVIACTNGNFTPDCVVYKPESRGQFTDWLRSPGTILERFRNEAEQRRAAASVFAAWEFEASLYEFNPLVQPYPPVITYRQLGDGQPISRDAIAIVKRLLSMMRPSAALESGRESLAVPAMAL